MGMVANMTRIMSNSSVIRSSSLLVDVAAAPQSVGFFFFGSFVLFGYVISVFVSLK